VHPSRQLRIVSLGLAILAVILVFLFISSRGSGTRTAATVASPTANVVLAATASPEELNTIKAWGLAQSDFPQGTVAVSAQEIPLYVAARNDLAQEKSLEAQGFIEGYEQEWKQPSAGFLFTDGVDLFHTPEQATARMRLMLPLDATSQLTELPAPNLGDASRMFSITSSPSGAPQQLAYSVEWVRGRTLLSVTSTSLPGGLQSQQILALAKTMDQRAASAPLP
jgi:hypothetical protein